MWWIFPLSLFSFLLPLCFAAQEPTVRVALLEEIQAIRLTVQAPCRITDLKTDALLSAPPILKWQQVRSSNPGLGIGPSEFSSQAVVVRPDDPETLLYVNAQPYRGALILRRTGRGRLTVVNRLGLEDYLVGALTSEVKPDWPMEVLKAHAVASRSMVAHRIWISREKPFDVTADTRTHLYYGVRAERSTTREAVEATRGQVLAYNGELFSSTFHANCGGHTEDAAEIWSVKRRIEPLSGVKDPYCRGFKHYRWKTRIVLDDLAEELGEEASGIGVLTGFEIIEHNRSGRVRSVKLVGAPGSVTLTGRRLRERLGADRLRSLKFTAEVSAGAVLFRGFGWGHGVGLCQWGAYGMARRGKTMDEVLAHYFPGAKRRNLQGLPGFDK